jgi:hypothetical protein
MFNLEILRTRTEARGPGTGGLWHSAIVVIVFHGHPAISLYHVSHSLTSGSHSTSRSSQLPLVHRTISHMRPCSRVPCNTKRNSRMKFTSRSRSRSSSSPDRQFSSERLVFLHTSMKSTYTDNSDKASDYVHPLPPWPIPAFHVIILVDETVAEPARAVM